MDQTLEAHGKQDDENLIRRDWTPFRKGMRWKCIQCAWCCVQGWAVNLTWPEYERARSDRRFAPLIIERIEVEEGTGRTHPYFVIERSCPLLDEKMRLCSVHPDWFYTCATWPFLLMPDGTLMVNESCRGFGSGDGIDPERMIRRIISERKRAGIA